MANETVSIYEPRTMGRVVSKMPPRAYVFQKHFLQT